MLKRILSFVLTIVFTAMVAACSGSGSVDTTPAPTPGAGAATEPAAEMSAGPTQAAEATAGPTPEPADDRFIVRDFNGVYASVGKEQVFESDDAYYYLCEKSSGCSLIYFSDREYKDWMPLCGKPECMHTPKDDGCNAYLEGPADLKIWPYGNRIYYVVRGDSDFTLWRMRLDGSGHEQVLVFPIDTNEYAGSGVFWFFHNKYLLLTLNSYTDMSEDYNRQIYVVDLGAEAPKAELFELVDESGSPAGLDTPCIGRDGLLFSIDEVSRSVYRIDIEARTKALLCTLPHTPCHSFVALYDDLLYFCDGWDEGYIVTVNIETGELDELNSAEPKENKWYYPYKGYIIGMNSSYTGEYAGTKIYDKYGALLKEIPYDDYGMDIQISCITGDFVFCYLYTDTGNKSATEPPSWYLDIRDIGADDLMWRRWEPEG